MAIIYLNDTKNHYYTNVAAWSTLSFFLTAWYLVHCDGLYKAENQALSDLSHVTGHISLVFVSKAFDASV